MGEKPSLAWSLLLRPLALLWIPVIVLAVLAACQDWRAARRYQESASPSSATITPVPSHGKGEMAVNRIAYVGSDGNIFTIKPDGTDSRRLTRTDFRVGPAGHILAQGPVPIGAEGSETLVFYAWPTWSPDSTRLAASRVTVEGASATFSLHVLDASTGKATRIYDNEPNTIPIAQGAPHFMYWSPDSKHLTFLASTPRELALLISTPEQGSGPTRLVGEAPLYFSWAGDSSALAVHRGPELLLVPFTGGVPQPPQSLGDVGMGFRAPALSRDASKMVYATEDGGGASLYLADVRLTESGRAQPGRAILDVGPSSVFMWSPTRDEVAVADTVDAVGPIYQQVTIVGDDGASKRVVVNEPLLAFFWSPDGEKIAYVAFDTERRSFTWKYVNRAEGRLVELAEFVPSAEFLTMISFFDQYAYPNSVWSPDSSQIVFSGTIGRNAFRRNGGSPEGDKVYVLDVREGSAPREIATSRFAVWSWK